MKTIKLKSQEGDVVNMKLNLARRAEALRLIVDVCGIEPDEELPLPIKTKILHKVIEWADHHKHIPIVRKDQSKKKKVYRTRKVVVKRPSVPDPAKEGEATANVQKEASEQDNTANFLLKLFTEDREEEEEPEIQITPYQTEFFTVDQSTVFEFIMAANVLDMPDLLEVGCKVVANMIKGKSVDEIRTTFNIKNDMDWEEFMENNGLVENKPASK